MTTKTALISIDVEDWYHLEYVATTCISNEKSSLGGVSTFLNLLNERGLKGTLFVLSDTVPIVLSELTEAIFDGHEIALHGTNHKRPLTMSIDEFKSECHRGLDEVERLVGVRPMGYRAPCFSMDRARLNVLKNELGFKYDSSLIDFGSHPLYGRIAMEGFDEVRKGVFELNQFVEFEMPTIKLGPLTLPISGGGYLRILPWFLMKRLIKKYLASCDVFAVYLHPFELAETSPPKVSGMSVLTKFRYRYNVKRTSYKVRKLLDLLQAEGFQFSTYREAAEKVVGESVE